jgi:uncharacterized protein with NRDE domain
VCLVALALDRHPRFPFILASNRDESFARASAPLGWWSARVGNSAAVDVLGGRDEVGGGTWLGLTPAGRLALVTNVRGPASGDPGAPSRGGIVTDWLATDEPPADFWRRTRDRGHNGFNLLAFDFARGARFWASNRAAGSGLRALGPGVHGVSNALLDTPWPKVVALKSRLGDALGATPRAPGSGGGFQALVDACFAALADRTVASDEALPATGVPLARERDLSPAFIRMPESNYGTRCSTIVVTERGTTGLATHVVERSFDAGGRVIATRQETLLRWPPGAMLRA